jgi:hypothetical protein
MILKINSKKHGQLNIIYDKNDQDVIDRYSWYVAAHATTGTLYVQARGLLPTEPKTVRLHRLIMRAPAGMPVDHINQNTLDNRECNLRVCKMAENTRNTRSHRDSRHKYKGVYKSPGVKKFSSQIMKNGKVFFLGCYDTDIDAALVYNGAAKLLFGEYAYLNQI